MKNLVKGDLVHHKNHDQTFVVMEVADDKVTCKTKSGHKIFNINELEKDEIVAFGVGIDNPFITDSNHTL